MVIARQHSPRIPPRNMTMTKKLTERAVKNWKHTGKRQEIRDGLKPL